uniref:Uncharacterized protein n=1 Tax=Hyaloperonospora arabidopsidis (strain Emoy2) TaxID=559515 RepID=M4BCC6_HYAAE
MMSQRNRKGRTRRKEDTIPLLLEVGTGGEQQSWVIIFSLIRTRVLLVHTLFIQALVLVIALMNIYQPTNSAMGILYKFTCKYKCSTLDPDTFICIYMYRPSLRVQMRLYLQICLTKSCSNILVPTNLWSAIMHKYTCTYK